MKIFDSIDSLDDGKYDWNLRVRVVRVWDSYSSKSGREFKGKNLLLLDDKQTRIHAFIWPNNIQDIKCEIEEGKIYTISNVQVKNYRDESIKCIQSNKQLWFSSRTKMQVLENYDHMIPNNVFDFYNLADVSKLPQALPRTQLIDVVGFIVPSEYNMRKIRNNSDVEQTQLLFTITDGRTTTKFCFWDAFAMSFDAALKEQEEKPVIVIVSSCRYNLFRNDVFLSNLTPTTFFLNYDHHSVEHLRERYNAGHIKLPDAEEEVVQKPEIMTLSSIQKLDPQYIKKHVMCQVTFVNVEQKSNWWYYSCTKCPTGVKDTGEAYECDECKRVVLYPKKCFRLCVNVQDESGGAAVLLFDREVQRIIGKNVYEVTMLHNQSGKKEVLPEIFKSVEGKKYTCTLEITEANVNQRSCMYTAVDIFEGFEAIDNSDSQTENSTMPYPNSEACETMSQNASVSIESFTTPDTEKSTTLKPTKRKIENVVVGNMASLNSAVEEDKDEKKLGSPSMVKNIKKERD